MHVVVTARYLGGAGRRVWFVAVTIGAILMLLRSRRRPRAAAHRGFLAHGRFVFGRHSTLIVGVAAVSAAALAGLLPHAVGAALREPLMRRAGALPLDFPHDKHGLVNCLKCHHNYVDTPGGETCVSCHRSSRADLEGGSRGAIPRLLLRVPPASAGGLQAPRAGVRLRRLSPGARHQAMTHGRDDDVYRTHSMTACRSAPARCASAHGSIAEAGMHASVKYNVSRKSLM